LCILFIIKNYIYEKCYRSLKGMSEGGRSVGGEQNVYEDIILCMDTLLRSYVVQHDHSWSENRV
jgi:hypothetical protein